MLLPQAVQGLALSLAWMPTGASRDYWTWALDTAAEAQRQEWLQVSGLSAIVRLYEMFARFLSDDEQNRLAPLATPIIVQQTYEIISDNLAIGLADALGNDRATTAKRRVLAVYNQVMIDKLNGAAAPVALLMAPARAAASELSAFAHNHNPAKTKALASAFAADADRQAALEHDLWPALVASCEATLALSQRLSGTPVGAMVSQGLLARYAGVSTLIAGGAFDLAKRLSIGADTILVRPTLAFFSGMIAQEIRPMRHWSTVVGDETVHRALSDSAVLVRLLNDVGTELLTTGEDTLTPQLTRLRSATPRDEITTLRALFGQCLETLGPAFNRIRKDVVLGEFNVALDEHAPRAASACVAEFIANIGELRRIFAERSRSLSSGLEVLSDRLGDPLLSNIINAFVQFHAQLYRHHFDDARGEFAV
jgi:hypothetical protein